ncbi:MAG: prohibitin family protein [Devosia sp.]
MKINFAIAAVILVILVAAFTVFGSWYTVDQGQEAILLRNGAVVTTEGPGLHFKTPWIDTVAGVSLQSHTQSYDQMESYSRDQQPATIQLSVNFHVPPGGGAQVYSEYGSFDAMVARLLDQKVPSVFKDVFGTYDAQSAIQQRAKLNTDVLNSLQTGIIGPLIIESVQIKDIKFSPDYEAAIAAKQQATVKVQEQQQLLAQEQVKAQIVATTAKGLSDAAIAEATGAAEAVKLNADAEAHAIQVKGDAEAAVIAQRGAALKDNPGVVALIQAEKWDGRLPTTMPPNATVPFLSLPVTTGQ